jgi:2-dehydro-3-deoxygalactonokinase
MTNTTTARAEGEQATAGGFVAVDWGSSARRAYALSAAGEVTDEMEDGVGTLTIARDRFPSEVAALRSRFDARPLLMAGMVGSNRGWIEAPYVPCPATLAEVAAKVLWALPGAAAIVPGVSLIEGERADVMRGEEVQVFGVAGLAAADDHALICHPGTHTKWIELVGGVLTRFRTVMTGELFALLEHHSILADLLAAPATVGPAFLGAVQRGWEGRGIGAELFAVRAGVLLEKRNPADASSLVSGLLIGADLRSGLADVDAGREILVVGRGSLTRLYAAAIGACGHSTRQIDGAQAFVAGMRALKDHIT